MPYASREDQLACKKRQYAANPEKFKARVQDYRRRNPAWKRVPNHEQRLLGRLRNRYGLKAADGRVLLAKKSGCTLCGAMGELHLDHDVPRSRGGSNDLDNFQWLCPPCNSSKGAFTTVEFIAHIQKILARRG